MKPMNQVIILLMLTYIFLSKTCSACKDSEKSEVGDIIHLEYKYEGSHKHDSNFVPKYEGPIKFELGFKSLLDFYLEERCEGEEISEYIVWRGSEDWKSLFPDGDQPVGMKDEDDRAVLGLKIKKIVKINSEEDEL